MRELWAYQKAYQKASQGEGSKRGGDVMGSAAAMFAMRVILGDW